MNQEERYQVLQILQRISEDETFIPDLIDEIKQCDVPYDFYEDLFEILYDFAYDKHLLYIKVSALFLQFEDDQHNHSPRNL